MPMADELGLRYRALFRGYGSGGSPQLVSLKERIAEQENVLREDAMYFLLISLDHMVIRSLSGYIPSIDSTILGQPMPEFSSAEDVDRMVTRSLEEIYGDLAQHRTEGEKSSANDVIRTINAKTDALAEIILWWRE
jgi:hypothetical protein